MTSFFYRRPILVIIFWSLLVHIPGITSPLLDYHAYRQCQTASMSRNYFRHGMHFLKPELDNYGPPARSGTEFPIYSYLVALLYKLFGLHEIFGRLLSCLFATWSATFLFSLVQPRLGTKIALWSALAMFTIPVCIYFTRTFQPEAMAMWGYLGFVLYLDRDLSEPTGWNWIRVILLGATGPLLKLPFLYLIVGMWFIVVLERRWQFFRSFRYLLIPLLISAATVLWYYYASSATDQVLPLTRQEHIQNLSSIFTLNFWTIHFISRFPEICATYSGLLLGGVGAIHLWKHHSSQFLWFGWFVLTIVYVILLGNYGIVHKYTDLPWAPINGVLIGTGIVWFLSQSQYTVITFFLIVAMPIHAVLRIKHWYRVERMYVFKAKATLDRVGHPNDLIITNTAEVPVLLYYVDRYGYAFSLADKNEKEIDLLLKNPRIRFFLTPKEGFWSEHPEWAGYFARRGQLIEEDTDFVLYKVN